MSLPASFQKYGIMTPDNVRATRRLMIGTEGLTNSGKTEFIMSAPGPKILFAIDCAFDSVLDNPNPPAWRDMTDTGFDTVKVPSAGQANQSEYAQYFKDIRKRVYELADLPELRTLGIDGDSDWWELHLLANFGRTDQIHPLQYTPLYAEKKAMTKRLWDSGKIIISTNKLKDMYEDVIGEDGQPKVDSKGKTVQRKVAGEYVRKGFPDQDYLWQLQIRHLHKKAQAVDLTALKPLERLKAIREGRTKDKPEWGIRIMKCKVNPILEGDELWGSKCNMRSLLEYVYPQINPTEWGF